jgi:UDP-N-acetylmuramate dehydrogenase
MGVAGAYARLGAALSGGVLANERMQRHTSYRIGGPAALYVTCDTTADLRVATEVLRDEGLPWVILGKGSNVLVSDGGYDGAVLTLGRDFRRFAFDDENRLHAGAGVSLQRLVTEAFDRGLAGLEFAVGIPGTVGGAVSMNAGSATQWVGAAVEEVVTYRPRTGLVRYAGSELGWFYRATTIPAREIILEATLALSQADPAAVKQTMEGMLARRRATQPLERPSCGSVFRNPPNSELGAAQLIDACGLKGFAVGGARVSTKHANFIVNEGGATAADVTQVIVHVMEEVRERYGIELQPEVKFLGFPA